MRYFLLALLITLGFAPRGAAQNSLILVASRGSGSTTPPSEGGFETPYAVNAGGPLHVSPGGLIFLADENYSGGATSTSGSSQGGVPATTYGQAPFQTERFGTFSYHLPTGNGAWVLTTLHTDYYWTAPGQRTFKLTIEEVEVETSYDIIGKAGGQNLTIKEEYPVTVADGFLDFTVSNSSPQNDVGQLSAFIVDVDPGTAPNPPVLSAIAGNGQITINITAPGASQVDLWRSTSSSVDTSGAADFEDVPSGFVDDTVTNGVQYWYRGKSTNTHGISADSNEVSATPTDSSPSPSGINLFVSPSGSDSNDGLSSGAPFLTINKARDTLRTMTSDGTHGPEWQGATIHLADGYYYQTSEFTLDQRDGGTSSNRVVYYSDNGGAIISGAKSVNDGAWTPVTSADTFPWSQIDPAYRADCYKLNVSALGINNGSSSVGISNMENWLMPIIDGQMRKVSRWPQGAPEDSGAWVDVDSWVYNGKYNSTSTASTFTFSETDPTGWAGQNVYAYGVWGAAWCAQWERLNSITYSGGTQLSINYSSYYDPGAYLIGGSKPFIALRNQMNVMAEGEYSWNFSNGMLYYRPVSGEGAPTNTSVTLISNLVRLGVDGSPSNAANYVDFNGVTFEGSRRRAVRVLGSTGNTFTSCTVRNFGGTGWEIKDVTNFTVDAGATHNGGIMAMYIDAGDRATLTSANVHIGGHEVYETDSTLYGDDIAYGIKVEVGSCGVFLDGVNIHDLEDSAVQMGSALFQMTDSFIDSTNKTAGDAGAVSPDYSFLNVGTVFARNQLSNIKRNPHQHISGGALFALYLESQSNWLVEDNMFIDCDQAINIAGGKFHVIRRNKATGCNTGQYAAPYVFGNRVGYTSPQGVITAELDSVGMDNEPWASSYPDLTDYDTGGAYASSIMYHEDIVFVDNMSTDAGSVTYMPTNTRGPISVGANSVGVDMTQLNYPAGSSGTPANGGGTAPLSVIYRE